MRVIAFVHLTEFELIDFTYKHIVKQMVFSSPIHHPWMPVQGTPLRKQSWPTVRQQSSGDRPVIET